MYCAYCSTQLPEDSNFCDRCGASTLAQKSKLAAMSTPRPSSAAADIPIDHASAQVLQSAPQNNPSTKMNETVSRPQGLTQPVRQQTAPVRSKREVDSFFKIGEYVIDEKVSAFKFTNAYKVFNTKGQQIGLVEQQKIGAGAKAARILIGGNIKALQTFKLDIKNNDGSALAGIQRGGLGSPGGIRSISISDSTGQTIGALKVLFSWFTPKIEIHDIDGQKIGFIQGDWKGWSFEITDAAGNDIGKINKKWAGAMKEIFTTADKYHVSVYNNAEGDYRTIIIAAAITLDMVLKEFKG